MPIHDRRWTTNRMSCVIGTAMLPVLILHSGYFPFPIKCLLWPTLARFTHDTAIQNITQQQNQDCYQMCAHHKVTANSGSWQMYQCDTLTKRVRWLYLHVRFLGVHLNHFRKPLHVWQAFPFAQEEVSNFCWLHNQLPPTGLRRGGNGGKNPRVQVSSGLGHEETNYIVQNKFKKGAIRHLVPSSVPVLSSPAPSPCHIPWLFRGIKKWLQKRRACCMSWMSLTVLMTPWVQKAPEQHGS